MRVSRGLAAAVAAVLPMSYAAAQTAPPNSSDPAELKQEIQDLAARLKVLERRLELQQEAAQTAAAETPVVKASPKGFSLQSKDGANVIKLRGLFQADDRYFLDGATPASTALLRRVRPILEGTVNETYDFRLMPDFGAGKAIIVDAYVAARFKPSFVLTAGKFKPPVGLERLQSATDIRFVERGLPTDLVPNRDIGLQLSGDLFGGRASYALGYFNGVADGTSSDNIGDVDTDGDGDAAARLFFQPGANANNFAWRGLGFGVSATYGHTDGTATNTGLAALKTPGQVNFFNYRTGGTPTFADGRRTRIVPQFYYYYGRFGVLGEYVESSQELTRVNGAVTTSDKLTNDAWQVAFHWFVTGEDEAYRGFTPVSTFSPKNHTWGALELVARYHQLRIDPDAFVGGVDSLADPATQASKATAWGLGVNWYFNQNIKWVLDYDRTKFDGGADRDDEQVLLSRVQLSF